MAYRFLGVKLLLETHHLFLGIGWIFPGMPKIKVVPETPYRGLLCTFHTLGNKVLHKTRCAKDRGRSKDTFGNRFEV
jgi:hypothetical protein